MRLLSKFLFVLAGLWAVVVSVYIAISPQTISSITARSGVEGTIVEQTTRQVSWYSIQGWWGLIILVLFAALYAGSAYFAATQRLRLLAIGMPIAWILTYLAGFSIGGYYLPAAIASLLGTALLLLQRPWRSIDQEQ